MAGISSRAANRLDNRFKFNKGTELNTDLGLDWYGTPHRGYDAQVGRFWQVDALADINWGISPYAFSSNNPILRNDPTGLLDTVNIYLTNVDVRPKPKPKPRIFWWPSYGGQTGKQLNAQTDMQLARLRDGQALLPGDDHAFYHRAHKAQQDWRSMNKATLYYFGATAAIVGMAIYAPAAYQVLLNPSFNRFAFGRSAGYLAKYKSWMGVGNALGDAMYQVSTILSDDNKSWRSYNPASTLGNLFVSNPLYSAIPGAIWQWNKGEESLIPAYQKGFIGDFIGNAPMPGMWYQRAVLEGYFVPVLGNVIADEIPNSSQ